MQKNIRRYWPIFLLPTLAAFLIGFVIPFIQGLYLSLCKFTTINKTTFVGLSNYVKAFQDEQFAHAFGFTASFTVVSTAPKGAVIVNEKTRIVVKDTPKKQQTADAAEDYGDDYDDTPPWEDEDETESEGEE